MFNLFFKINNSVKHKALFEVIVNVKGYLVAFACLNNIDLKLIIKLKGARAQKIGLNSTYLKI